MLAAPASPPDTPRLDGSLAREAAPDLPPTDADLSNATLFDGSALAIVLAGTVIATLARSGLKDVAIAGQSLAALTRAGMDEDANRTAIARWARAIRERGVLGADVAMPPDADLARALNALVRTGSIKALRATQDEASAHRLRERGRAVRVFEQAGDLAPVFGLVGTLFSMTQLAPTGDAASSAVTMGAIATAVLSSLYGVLAAHFVFLPLAHAVARRSQREDDAREDLIAWLADEIADVMPGVRSPRVTPIQKVA